MAFDRMPTKAMLRRRVRAVGPQAGEQDPERGGEQRNPERLDDIDAGRQRRFGQEAHDHGQ